MTNPTGARDLAADARLKADGATLENERERQMRSAAAWDVIAAREERVQAARDKRNQEAAAAPPGD